MDDTIENELEQLAEEHDRDLDSLKEKFEDRLEEVRDRLAEGVEMDESGLHRAALQQVRSSIQYSRRTGGGEVEELPIFAIGHMGSMQWTDRDNGGTKEVCVAVGIVAPDDLPDENRPAGVAAFVCDESVGVDIGNVREKFQFGNHLKGWFDINKSSEFKDRKQRTYYLGNSTDRTRVEEVDLTGTLPTDPSDQREFAHQYIPEEASVAEIADYISREGEEFGTGWLDQRRITGHVVDAYRDESKDLGIYKVTDSSVTGPEELERLPYMTDDDVEEGRTPGFTVWTPPEFVVYGRDSVVELYGTIVKDGETGQITMNASAVAPIVPYEYEDQSSDSGGDHDDVETNEL